MAGGFNFTSEMNLQLSYGSLKNVTNQIQSGLRGIRAEVDVQVSSGAITAVNNLRSQVVSLNSSLNASQTAAAQAAAGYADAARGYTSLASAASASGRSLSRSAAEMREAARAASEGASAAFRFGEQTGLAVRRFAAFTLAAGGMVSAVAAFKNAIGEAVTFQRELVRLQQVGGDTQDQIRGLQAEVTRLATGLGVSGKELLSVATVFRQAGLSLDETKVSLEAIAKAALAPNFDSMAETAEGAIAIFQQFKVSGKELEGVLGSINAVAGEFAVESKDLIGVIQRAGGTFKSAGGDLNELLALFTSIRATTRESAESIATGLRTVFTRVQRNDTIDALKQLGIELRFTKQEASSLGDLGLENQFVGPYEAVKRLADGIKDLRGTDPRTSAIIEQLGGYRQVSKVIPLLQQQEVAQKALNAAVFGGFSITQAATTAQDAFLVKITKVHEQFQALGRTVLESKGFQAFADVMLRLASAAIKLADALTPLIPTLAVLAAVRIGGSALDFARGLGTRVQPGRTGFASGGSVPGQGTTDTIPAMLTPGEFVLNRDAVKRIGLATLHRANQAGGSGQVQHFARGGAVGMVTGGDPVEVFFRSLSKSDPARQQALDAAAKEGITLRDTTKLLIQTVSSVESVFKKFVQGAGSGQLSAQQIRDEYSLKGTTTSLDPAQQKLLARNYNAIQKKVGVGGFARSLGDEGTSIINEQSVQTARLFDLSKYTNPETDQPFTRSDIGKSKKLDQLFVNYIAKASNTALGREVGKRNRARLGNVGDEGGPIEPGSLSRFQLGGFSSVELEAAYDEEQRLKSGIPQRAAANYAESAKRARPSASTPPPPPRPTALLEERQAAAAAQMAQAAVQVQKTFERLSLPTVSGATSLPLVPPPAGRFPLDVLSSAQSLPLVSPPVRTPLDVLPPSTPLPLVPPPGQPANSFPLVPFRSPGLPTALGNKPLQVEVIKVTTNGSQPPLQLPYSPSTFKLQPEGSLPPKSQAATSSVLSEPIPFFQERNRYTANVTSERLYPRQVPTPFGLRDESRPVEQTANRLQDEAARTYQESALAAAKRSQRAEAQAVTDPLLLRQIARQNGLSLADEIGQRKFQGPQNFVTTDQRVFNPLVSGSEPVDGRQGVNRRAFNVDAFLTNNGANKNDAFISARYQQLVDAITQQVRELNQTLTHAQAQKKAQAIAAQAMTKNSQLIVEHNGASQQLLGLVKQQLAIETGKVRQATLSESLSRNVRDLRSGATSGGITNAFGNLASGVASRFGNIASAGGLFLAPFLSQGIEGLGGTPEAAVAAGGSATGYRAAQGASGGLQGAALGGTVGFAVGGPVGAAVGAAAGALYGFVTSLQEAERSLRQVRLVNAVNEFGDKLRQLVNSTPGSNDVGTIRSAREQIGIIEKESIAKAVDASTHLFTGQNLKETSAVLTQTRREQFGNQLPNISSYLTREAEQLGRANVGQSLDKLKEQFLDGGDSFNREMVTLIASVQKVPVAQVQQQFLKTIQEGQRLASLAASDSRVQITVNGTLNAFERLAGGVQAAATNMARLQQDTKSLSDVLDGVIGGSAVRGTSDNVRNLAVGNRGFGESLGAIAAPLGAGGAGFRQTGLALNSVGDVLPTILSQLLAGQPLGQEDFTLQLGNQLRAALPQGGPESDKLIDLVTNQFGKQDLSKLLEQTGGDVSKLVDQLLAPVAGPFKEAGERIAKEFDNAANLFIDNLTRNAQLGQRIGGDRDRVSQIELGGLRARAEIQAQAAGRRSSALDFISLEQLQRPLQVSQERLTNLRGDQANNPAAIAARLRDVTAAIPDTERRQQRGFLASGQDNGAAFRGAAQNLTNLKTEAANLQQALRNLADASGRNAAIQEKLSQIQQDKDSRLGFGERFLSASGDEAAQINRGLLLASQAKEQGFKVDNFSPEDRKLLFSTLGSLGNAKLTGFGGITAKDFRENLIRNSAGGVFGLDAQSKQEEGDLQKKLIENFDTAQKAQEALVQVQTNLQEQFFKRLESIHDNFFVELKRQETQRLLTVAQNDVFKQGQQISTLKGRQEQAGVLAQFGVTTDEDVTKLRNQEKQFRALFDSITQAKQLKKTGEEAEQRIGNFVQPFDRSAENRGPGPESRYFLTGEKKGLLQEDLINAGFNQPQAQQIIERFADTYDNTRNKGSSGSNEALKTALLQAVRDTTNQGVADIQNNQVAAARRQIGGFTPEQLNKIGEAPDFTKLLAAANTFNDTDKKLSSLGTSLTVAEAEFQRLTVSMQALRAALEPQGGQPAPAQARARGGVIYANRGLFTPKGTDTVPAMLTPGEYVINEASSKANRELLERINEARGPVYLAGGGFPLFPRGEDPYVPDHVRVRQAVQEAKQKIGDPSQTYGTPSGPDAPDQFAQTYGTPKGPDAPSIFADPNRINPLTGKPSTGSVIVTPTSGPLRPRRQREAAVQNPRVRQQQADVVAYLGYFSGQARNLASQQRLAQSGDVFGSFGAGRADNSQRQIASSVLGVQSKFDHLDSLQRNAAATRGLSNFVRQQYFNVPDGGRVRQVRRFASGGAVGTDTIPAMLSPGEFVLNSRATANIGVGNLNRINHYATGGPVGNASSGPGSGLGLTLSPEASQALNGFTNAATQFGTSFKSDVGLLQTAMTSFGTDVKALADVLQKFPRTLELTGQQRLEVVVNGAEALSRVMPELQQMVVDKIDLAIKKMLKDKLPDVQ